MNTAVPVIVPQAVWRLDNITVADIEAFYCVSLDKLN